MVYVYLGLLVAGAIITFAKFRNSKVIALLALIFGITLCVEVIAKFILARNHLSNHWLLSGYLPVEYLLFSALYYFHFTGQGIRRIIVISSGVAVLFSIVNIVAIQKVETFNTYTLLFTGSLILTWVFIYFRGLLRAPAYVRLFSVPMFWISTGLLFFYSGNIFVAGTINYFNHSDENFARILMQIIKLLNILMFSLFIAAALCQIRRKS